MTARLPETVFAVAGKRIVALSSEGDVAQYIGPRTRVIDLKGRRVLPAFGDVHTVSAGPDSLRCNLFGLRTREECLATITTYAQRLPADAWVIGGGWSLEGFPDGPLANDLDAVCAGRPAFLPNRDDHSARVNTIALERAGVGPETPDPFNGRIEAPLRRPPDMNASRQCDESRGAHRPGTDDCEQPFFSTQTISVAAAVEAFTRGIALVDRAEADHGVHAHGARAELIVLDHDLLTINQRSIGDTPVALSVASGEIVHGDQ